MKISNLKYQILNIKYRIQRRAVHWKLDIGNWIFNIPAPRGFTLIELLIVIAVIGILAALPMANFVSIREKVRDSQRKGDLKQIQSALETYKADIGTYPLSPIPECGSILSENSIVYLKKIPCDPFGTDANYYNFGEYYYWSDGNASYTLVACLENKSDSEGVDGPPPDEAPFLGCESGRFYVLENQ